MKNRFKLLFTVLLFSVLSASAADDVKLVPLTDPLYQVDTLSGRIYYRKPDKYSMSHFMGAIDIPTCFGVGFVPNKKSAERFAYYGAMFLEYRYRKSYGWYFEAGLDQHDHDYKDYTFEGKDRRTNVASGTVFNMQLVAGGGYRIPLVRDLKEFYAHPYVNKWNLSTLVQVGGAWSRLKNVRVDEADNQTYHLDDVHHFYPVLKFGCAVEYFTGPSFSIFFSANYMQHLIRQPWDTSDMTGTLSFGIGFAGFFN